MTRLALIALMSLIVAAVLCYGTLWIAEHIAEAHVSRSHLISKP